MKGKIILQKLSIWLQGLAYTGAGINHFINPGFYYPLIPPYVPLHHEVNIISGVAEILLGLGLIIWAKQRKLIAWGIILLLIAVMPAHIYHLQMGGCLPGAYCIPVWACIARIILQFVLIGWAWSVRKLK